MELNKVGVAASVAATVVFIFTVVLYFTAPGQQRREYVVSFPDTAGGAPHHERRILPQREDATARVETVVRELMLGPIALGAVPFIAEDARLNSVVVDDETATAYIDFSADILFGMQMEEFPFDEVEVMVKHNIARNVRRIDEIVVTVEGQLPGVPRFEGL